MSVENDQKGFKKIKRIIRPNLIRLIKNILQQYPDDSQIFKELIQNAEDAGASCVKFIYNKNDYRQSPDTEYSVDGLRQYQGPALLAFNDAEFTNEDWIGINSLGTSIKEKDPLKVGKFGLGFKSIFHLTDMPMILSGTVFTYVDPMARLFYDEEEKSYIEVKMIDFSEEEQTNNCEDLNYYKTLPGVFRFDADGKYHGTLFRFPFRDLAPENPNSLSDNCFNSEKINGLISAFKEEAATMLVFLKNVNQITFEVLDGAEIVDTYSAKVSQSSLQTYRQTRKEFLTNIKEEMEKETFTPHSVTYEIKLKELLGDELKELHFCLSEFFGSNYDREFMDMVKDKDLSYVPLVGVAYRRDNPHSGGHIYCGLPLPFSQESLTGLPVHVNGYFALGPDRKDLKWKSISTAKSGDKSVLWNEILIKKLLLQAYLNLLKFLINLELKSSDVYGAWPSKDKVNSKWKMFLPKFHSQLVKERCIFSDGMEIWEIPSKIQLLKRRYFKQESEFEVIYKYLKSIKYKFAVVPEELLAGVQGSVVMDRAAMQNLVAQNINIYRSFNKEEQNFLLSYAIRDQADAAKFIGKIPLRMASGLFANLSSTSSAKIYVPVDPYSKDFLLSYEKVIDVEYYSHKNTQVLQALGKTGMQRRVFVKEIIEGY